MKNLNNIFTGSIATFGVDTATVSEGFNQISNVNLNSSMIVSIIGGVIATIAINILKSKFPKLFEPIKPKEEKKENGEG